MTAPAGSEDAGLVLSAEEHNDHGTNAGHLNWDRWVYPEDAVVHIVAARVEVARAEERERIAAAIEAFDTSSALGPCSPGDVRYAAARIARTPPPAGEATP